MSAGNITIRPALPGDARGLWELNLLFNGEGAQVEAVARSLEENRDELVAVALDGDRAVGFLCGQITRSFCYQEASGELTELYVREEYRGRGIARALMEHMERRFLALGIRSLRLLTGRDNGPAKGLYQSCGFVPEDEVLFVKILED